MNTPAKTIETSPRAVCMFHAEWCAPSQSVLGIFYDLADFPKFAGVAFLDITLDEFPEIAKAYQVKGTPTLMYFANGKPVGSLLGNVDYDTMTAWLMAQMEKPVPA